MPTESRIKIDFDEEPTFEQRTTALKALDLLATALAGHGHQWADEERQAYDEAVAAMRNVGFTSPTYQQSA